MARRVCGRASTLLLAIGFFGCGKVAPAPYTRPVAAPSSTEPTAAASPIRHAQCFALLKENGRRVVEVHNPWRKSAPADRYLLVPRGETPPADVAAARVVFIPLRRLAATSTTYLPALDELAAIDRLVGFPSPQYVSNPKVLEAFRTGAVRSIGSSEEINYEAVAELDVDALVTSGMGDAEAERYRKLRRIGVAVLLTAEFAEQTPLGRAEWIRFFGAFLDREQAAEAIFRSIEKRYQELADLPRSTPVRPTVFLNAPYRGVWYMPGERNFMARFLTDAGAQFLWADMDSLDSRPLNVEAVVAKAANAEFWLNTGEWMSRAEAVQEDPRHAVFAAYHNRHMYNNKARMTPSGGNDYWETGLAHPEEVLADLVAVFHPDLLPNHRLKYYRKLP